MRKGGPGYIGGHDTRTVVKEKNKAELISVW